jgi:hypothetical protein
MGYATAMAWALFAACALDVLTLPASTGPVQVGARALVGAVCFVFAFAVSLRQRVSGTRASLYPPSLRAEGARAAGLRLVHPAPLRSSPLHD